KLGEGTLIVNKDPTSAAKIAEAKKDLGGGKVYTGTVHYDPKTDELVFETPGDPPDVRTLRAVISRDAGLSLKVAARKAGSLTIKDVVDAVEDLDKEEVKKGLSDLVKSDTYKLVLSLG